ncbi:MAG: aminoacyl-tRNA hydrolase [Dehalococcoidia bacterium]|nr:aminoacyl-tRNA hydrolase [Dehalococcoidia bacterium]
MPHHGAMRERFAQFRRSVGQSDPETTLEAPPLSERRPVLVVGLGNPGDKYARSRHNVGQWCIRELARRHQVQFAREGRMELGRADIEGTRLYLGRVLSSYYNDSGGPVQGELRHLGLAPWQLLVVYDELDLPVAQIRIRAFGGHGGNNGMRSIVAALGSQDFARIRVGIDRPYDDGTPVRDPDRIASWVLGNPPSAEREQLEAVVVRAADAIEVAARDGIEAAMSRFNP